MNEVKKVKFVWWRALLCAVLACIVMVILFDLHTGTVADILSDFSAEDEANLIWLIKHISAGIPVFVLVAIINLFYLDKQRYVPVYTQLEKLLIFLAVAIFTFVIMLFSVYKISDMAAYIQTAQSAVPVTDPESLGMIYRLFPMDAEELNLLAMLWDENHMWFFAQVLPFLIIISYHGIRITSEKSELAENVTKSVESDCDDEDDEDDEDDGDFIEKIENNAEQNREENNEKNR